MKSVLITGGAGFIGSHLAAQLLTQGASVRVLDNLSSGNSANLSPIADQIEMIEGDIRDIRCCARAAEGVDTIFHMAAMVSVPQSVKDPIKSNLINGEGTLNVLSAARDHGCRFIFSSSAAVYGDVTPLAVREDALPKPASPYGVQKLMGENYARIYHNLYGVETISLRYFNVYGPRQNPDSEYAAVIPKFMTRMLSGDSPIIYGDGEQTRDFLSVHDIVDANILAATTKSKAAIGSVFNIAGGCSISLNKLVDMMREVLSCDIEAKHGPARQGDIRHSQADVTLADRVLGFSQHVLLSRGLIEVMRSYSGESASVGSAVKV